MLGDEPDDLGQDAARLRLGLVLAAAVRRLDEDVVGVARRRVGSRMIDVLRLPRSPEKTIDALAAAGLVLRRGAG